MGLVLKLTQTPKIWCSEKPVNSEALLYNSASREVKGKLSSLSKQVVALYIVDLLIKLGADVNAFGGSQGTAQILH